MLSEENINFLKNHDIIKYGHFKLSSGLHSDIYAQCAILDSNPKLMNHVVGYVSAKIVSDVWEDFDLVMSPAVGAIIFGHKLAEILEKRFIYTERVNGVMSIRRSFESLNKIKVLIAEDVITTGKSIRELKTLVDSAGGKVVGYASVINRGDQSAYSFARVSAETWEPSLCPLCSRGLSIYAPGSRFLFS